jgi:hypothetical protein
MQVITGQNTGMLKYTTVKVLKLQFPSLVHNVGAGHAGLPYRPTVRSLRFGRVFQGEWDLYERVWNRQEERAEAAIQSSRSWFRASSVIKLNKNQLDAHLV